MLPNTDGLSKLPVTVAYPVTLPETLSPIKLEKLEASILSADKDKSN